MRLREETPAGQKGYQYHFVFAHNSGHVDDGCKSANNTRSTGMALEGLQPGEEYEMKNT
jgi:hypothetical protein